MGPLLFQFIFSKISKPWLLLVELYNTTESDKKKFFVSILCKTISKEQIAGVSLYSEENVSHRQRL